MKKEEAPIDSSIADIVVPAKPSFKKSFDFTVISNSPQPIISNSCCTDDNCTSAIHNKPLDQQPCCSDENCVDNITMSSKKEELMESGFPKEYRVQGMDCPASAVTIEKSLKQLDHIQQVVVNYSTAKMQIISDHPSVYEKVPKVLKNLGFTVETIELNSNTRTYNIEGMDCSSCALTIENHLKDQPSIKSIQVNFSTGKMRLEHDNDVQTIINEVAKVGFRASLVSKSHEKMEPKKSNQGMSLIIFSGAMLAIGSIGSLTGVSPTMNMVLYIISMITGGYKPARSAFYAIKSRSLDMNVLMVAAAIGAAVIGQ